jgi:hypothetical protein
MQDASVEEDRRDKSPPLVAVENESGLLGAIADLQRR